MAELTIVTIPAKQLADGTNRIRIRINHNNQTLYITTQLRECNLK